MRTRSDGSEKRLTGCLWATSPTVPETPVLRACTVRSFHETVWESPDGSWLPDLGVAPTVGCLLALVRETYGAETYTQPLTDEEEPTRWEVGLPLRWGRRQISEGATEVEALVAAIEQAPSPLT